MLVNDMREKIWVIEYIERQILYRNGARLQAEVHSFTLLDRKIPRDQEYLGRYRYSYP